MVALAAEDQGVSPVHHVLDGPGGEKAPDWQSLEGVPFQKSIDIFPYHIVQE